MYVMKGEPFYLECEDSNIANIGAIFRGKSAMESMVCVHCKTGEAGVKPVPWVVRPEEADEILKSD